MRAMPRPLIATAALVMLVVPFCPAPESAVQESAGGEDLHAFAERAAARLGLRPIEPGGSIKGCTFPKIYLTHDPCLDLAACNHLRRVPGLHDGEWIGTLMIEPLRKSFAFCEYDGEWGEHACLFEGFLIYGDPDLVRKIREDPPQSD